MILWVVRKIRLEAAHSDLKLIDSIPWQIANYTFDSIILK